jgi:hypothetical protein
LSTRKRDKPGKPQAVFKTRIVSANLIRDLILQDGLIEVSDCSFVKAHMRVNPNDYQSSISHIGEP